MESVANGNWLTRERVTDIAAICGVAGAGLLLFLWLFHKGTIDYFGQPVGADFAPFWQAGHIANMGDPSRAWDQQLLNDSVKTTHGVEYGTAWIYPPVFLFIAAPLGAIPYLLATFLWQALSFASIALILKGILKNNRDTLIALASPLTPLVLANGQNSFLTAALFGAGLLLMSRRPIVSGALFGGLVYKPQLGIIIGPLLLFTKSWRALAGAAVAAVFLVGLSVLLWGVESWAAWLGSLRYGRHYMEEGSVGFYKSVSLFATVRNWGAGVTFGYVAQTIGMVAGIVLLWRARLAPSAIRAAAAGAAAALSTPYLLDYDLAIVGVGAAFLYSTAREKGFLSYERVALAFIWAAPLYIRPIQQFALVPLGTLTILLLAWLAWRRLSEDHVAAGDRRV